MVWYSPRPRRPADAIDGERMDGIWAAAKKANARRDIQRRNCAMIVNLWHKHRRLDKNMQARERVHSCCRSRKPKLSIVDLCNCSRKKTGIQSMGACGHSAIWCLAWDIFVICCHSLSVSPPPRLLTPPPPDSGEDADHECQKCPAPPSS